MKLVEVIWDDAWVDPNDTSLEHAKELKPVRRQTVGYLVLENDSFLTLCADFFHGEPLKEVNTTMVIPMGMIVEWWELK